MYSTSYVVLNRLVVVVVVTIVIEFIIVIDNVYLAIIMTLSLREFTQFI